MPMPYTLTKGPLLTLLENTLNPSTAEEIAIRNSALLALRGGAEITSIPWVTSPPVAAVPIPQGPDPVPQGTLDVRLDRDWFGKKWNGSGWNPQAGFSGQATGYWVGYYGHVEEVLREGVIRAMEVSLGINRDQSPEQPTRQWPVEVNWKCPNPWFEVWVTWRRHRKNPEEGHVTMLICTPPDKSNRLTTRPMEPPPPQPPQPPVATGVGPGVLAAESQGMWVVTRDNHVEHTVDQVVTVREGSIVDVILDTVAALQGMPEQQWAVPTPTTFWEDQGDVVVVAPPSYAGGADPNRSNAP